MQELGFGLGALAPRGLGQADSPLGTTCPTLVRLGGDAPGPAGQRAQGHRKAACAHPKGKGLRPLVGARRLA